MEVDENVLGLGIEQTGTKPKTRIRRHSGNEDTPNGATRKRHWSGEDRIQVDDHTEGKGRWIEKCFGRGFQEYERK